MIDRRRFKGMSIFLIFASTIKSEMEDFRNYIAELDENLKTKQKEVEEKYDEATKELSEEEQQMVHDYFEDDIHKYFRVFPIYTFNPLLISIYGYFESQLKKLCELDHRRGFSKIKVNDLAGNNYIEKSRNYLILIADINLESMDSIWKRIGEIQKIRNAITHQEANIIKDKTKPIEKQELYKVMKNDPRFKFDESNGDFYINQKEFILEVVEIAEKYLTGVCNQLAKTKIIARNTEMPYDNVAWGQEKSENMIKELISAIHLTKQHEERTDEFKDTDFRHNLLGTLNAIAYDLTKIYSFFCGGKWEVKDASIIMDEKEEGLNKLKELYGAIKREKDKQ